MDLNLVLVVRAETDTCLIRWLDGAETVRVAYAAPVRKRVKILPTQLVAVDVSGSQPEIVWRWFRGRVEYMVDDCAVVNNHGYGMACRAPISVARLPDVLEDPIQVGDEVFYSLGEDGVVIDVVRNDTPAHPERLRADLLPALVDVYAEMES